MLVNGAPCPTYIRDQTMVVTRPYDIMPSTCAVPNTKVKHFVTFSATLTDFEHVSTYQTTLFLNGTRNIARCHGHSWLRYQCSSFMMTSLNGNMFRVIGHLCGKFTGHRWISRTKASDAELWCYCDLRLNKQLSKQWWGWWFETPSHPLWRHCNVTNLY